MLGTLLVDTSVATSNGFWVAVVVEVDVVLVVVVVVVDDLLETLPNNAAIGDIVKSSEL